MPRQLSGIVRSGGQTRWRRKRTGRQQARKPPPSQDPVDRTPHAAGRRVVQPRSSGPATCRVEHWRAHGRVRWRFHAFRAWASVRLPWPRFQPPPLKFRTVGFPQYGFKFQAPHSSAESLPVVGRRLKFDPAHAPPPETVGSRLRDRLGRKVSRLDVRGFGVGRPHLDPEVLAPVGFSWPHHHRLSTSSASLVSSGPFPSRAGYRHGL